MDLLTKWMKDKMDSVHTILEQMAIEQLMNTLPRNVYIWVRQNKPDTVLQAGQLADEYVLVRKQSGGLPKKEQRPEGRPDNVRVCSYCHKKGHTTEDCRKAAADKVKGNGQQRPKPDHSKMRCYQCQEMGHISLNCPKKAALYNAEAFNVEKEHNEPLDGTSMQFSREGIVEGMPVKGIVLDTDCTRTMV